MVCLGGRNHSWLHWGGDKAERRRQYTKYGKARQRSTRPNAARNGEPYPGTGIDRWGCFLPDLTRFTT